MFLGKVIGRMVCAIVYEGMEGVPAYRVEGLDGLSKLMLRPAIDEVGHVGIVEAPGQAIVGDDFFHLVLGGQAQTEGDAHDQTIPRFQHHDALSRDAVHLEQRPMR